MSDETQPTEPMTLDQYQDLARVTNCYDEKTMLYALVLGVTSEAGEIADKLKKHLRGDNPTRESEISLKHALKAEIGDVLWYVSELARLLGFSLSDVAQANLDKLASRQTRDMIKGNGDDR